MAVDRQAMREQMREQLMERTKKGTSIKGNFQSKLFKEGVEGIKFFSCKEGDHIIDIIPYFAGNNDPMVAPGKITYNFSFYIHRNVGTNKDQRILCPEETFGEKCPICDHVRELRKQGVDKKIINNVMAKPRTLYNVVCYDSDKEADKGVQIFDVSYFYMEKYLAKLAKGPMQRGGKRGAASIEPNVHFADAENGRSICFSVSTQGREFPEYSAHQFEKRDYVIDNQTLEEAFIFDELIYKPTFDEVYELFIQAQDDENDDQAEDEEPPKRAAGRGRVRKPEPTPEEEVVEEEEEEKPIVPAKRKTEVKKKEADVCPFGGNFGIEANEFEECDNCYMWEKCVAAQNKEEEPEQEEEQEPEEIPEEEPVKPRKRKATTSSDDDQEAPAPSTRRRRKV